MSAHQFVFALKGERVEVELSERGEFAVLRHRGRSQQAKVDEAGSRLWGLLREAGLEPQAVPMVTVSDVPAEGEPKILASIHPLLTGARVTWTPMFRADELSSCFKLLAGSLRISDALETVFRELRRIVLLPHKP